MVQEVDSVEPASNATLLDETVENGQSHPLFNATRTKSRRRRTVLDYPDDSPPTVVRAEAKGSALPAALPLLKIDAGPNSSDGVSVPIMPPTHTASAL